MGENGMTRKDEAAWEEAPVEAWVAFYRQSEDQRPARRRRHRLHRTDAAKVASPEATLSIHAQHASS